MTISLKDKASAEYREMKGKLDRKIASMECQAIRLDGKIEAQIRERVKQLAVTLGRPAATVRRAS